MCIPTLFTFTYIPTVAACCMWLACMQQEQCWSTGPCHTLVPPATWYIMVGGDPHLVPAAARQSDWAMAAPEEINTMEIRTPVCNWLVEKPVPLSVLHWVVLNCIHTGCSQCTSEDCMCLSLWLGLFSLVTMDSIVSTSVYVPACTSVPAMRPGCDAHSCSASVAADRLLDTGACG